MDMDMDMDMDTDMDMNTNGRSSKRNTLVGSLGFPHRVMEYSKIGFSFFGIAAGFSGRHSRPFIGQLFGKKWLATISKWDVSGRYRSLLDIGLVGAICHHSERVDELAEEKPDVLRGYGRCVRPSQLHGGGEFWGD